MSMPPNSMIRKLAIFSMIATLCACSSGQPDTNEGDAPNRAEYIAAVEATAACVEDKGFSVGEVTENPDGLTYGFQISSVTDDSTEGDAVGAAFSQCAGDHLNTVEREYLSSVQLSGQERTAAYEGLIVCLDSAGVSGVEVGDTEDVVTGIISGRESEGFDTIPAWECLDRYLIPLFGV